MYQVRPPAVAGSFYPGRQQALSQNVLDLLKSAEAGAGQGAAVPKALIVPHAGYVYSGSTAALAYARLAPAHARIKRVVLLGPVHRVAVRGLALSNEAAFATPLGQIEIDQEAVTAIRHLSQVVSCQAAHAQEHSLEVQLPFLQSVLDDFKLVPLAVGDATAEEVAQVLELLWGGPETLIVISSDLSHFLSYQEAQTVDRGTVQSILQNGTLTHQQACGGTPINGLLLAVSHHHLSGRLLGLCNSGDTAGDKRRVVGYAAFAFFGSQSMPASDAGAILLAIARASISSAFGLNGAADETASWLRQPGACFVTLMQRGRLRGCIGSLEARRSLLADLKSNALAAAFHDPRFAPLTLPELGNTEIEVSLLSAMQAMSFDSEAGALAQLRPNVDGVVFEYRHRRSTFLPQVWEQLPSVAQFMMQLKLKAGLSADFWDPEVRLQRYSVSKWSDRAGQSAIDETRQDRSA